MLGDHEKAEAPIQPLGAIPVPDVQRHAALRLGRFLLERTNDRRSNAMTAPRREDCDVDEPQRFRAPIHTQPSNRLRSGLDHIEARVRKPGAMRTLLRIELQGEQCIALRGGEQCLYDITRGREQPEQERTVC